jgi:hypothetical protein
MLSRIVQTESTIVQKALEGEVEKIEAERHRLEQLHDQSPQQEINYEKKLRTHYKKFIEPLEYIKKLASSSEESYT